MKLYLSGLGSESPGFQARFAAAEEYLAHLGPFDIVNPAAFPCMALWDWEDCILHDLQLIRGVDAVVALPGAEGSRDSRIEMEFARGRRIPVLDLCDVRAWAIQVLRSAI